jgi:hypothetical protein
MHCVFSDYFLELVLKHLSTLPNRNPSQVASVVNSFKVKRSVAPIMCGADDSMKALLGFCPLLGFALWESMLHSFFLKAVQSIEAHTQDVLQCRREGLPLLPRNWRFSRRSKQAVLVHGSDQAEIWDRSSSFSNTIGV